MSTPSDLYRPSLALLTDLYQLTMAYGYWKLGVADHESVFHLTFRKNPFKGGYAVACGLAQAIDYLQSVRFDAADIDYLATLSGNDDKPLFSAGFLDHLSDLRFSCDVDAVPEGTIVFPHEPLIRLTGPMLQCQLFETALLNMINFQTLIATKATRICEAASDDAVFEFGLRRAQGIDGGLAASRAAYVGGCAGTSNVLAGQVYGIPVKGTHAHSWVMCFEDELKSFEAYADAMPNNCVFLVDTYDTVEGVKNAVKAGLQLRERGYEMVGIRLDSGDLAWLSIQARQILDEGGFPDAAIVASNDLDENLITSLKNQGAKIAVWGIGTKLATAYDQPALGGVYKLSAMRAPGGEWEDRIKLSEQAIKVSNPGIHQVRRFYGEDGTLAIDMIYDIRGSAAGSPAPVIVDPMDLTRRKHVAEGAEFEDLLVPVFRAGELQYELPTLDTIRARRVDQLSKLHAGVRRFENPHSYPVGLEQSLYDHRMKMILDARGEGGEDV